LLGEFEVQPPVQSRSLRQKEELLLFQKLAELVQGVTNLATQVTAQINAITHSGAPDTVVIGKECDNYLQHFKKLSEVAIQLKAPVEEKLFLLSAKGPGRLAEPVPATRLQSVMVLHFTGELSMAKRLEELRHIEARTKESRTQLEMGLKTAKERFEEATTRLNLLLYMKECLEKEGTLPGNIMYNSKFPQVVASPFGLKQIATRMPNFASAGAAASPSAPKSPNIAAALPKISATPAVPHHIALQEQKMQELEKQRERLLQLREQAKKFREEARQAKAQE
ncbi:MAG TPA: hypothetical protein VN457_03835, partial [Chlamydiales bacterium]|nr:hypothetical protein [Chlamydiales bacterium]